MRPTVGLSHRTAAAIALRSVLPGRGVELPTTLYPRADLEARWATLAADPELRKQADRAQGTAAKYLRIPDAQWVAMIPNRSTSPRYAQGDSKTCERCPLTGSTRFYTYLDWGSLDLEKNPYRIRSRFSERWICERQEDVTPADGQVVDGHDMIPHWDGKSRELAYTLSKVLRNTKGQPAKYYPANIVWHGRLRKICYQAVPALHDAYMATGDDAYAAKLIVVLTRLADVIPAMPLARWRGLELLPITREEFLSAPRPRIFGPTPWHWSIIGGPARIMPDYTNIADDGNVAGHLAKAYLLIERSPAWGQGPAADQRRDHVKQNLLNELGLMLSACGTQVGNHAVAYIRSLLALGVILQDEHFFGRYNEFLENWLYNQNYYDAISTEGSVGYSAMMETIRDAWIGNRGAYDPGFLKKHPFLMEVGSTRRRIVTLFGKPSEHGDSHDGFGVSWPEARSNLGPAGRERREPSTSWPGFGVSLLRSGGPGRRLEISLSHDRVTGHGHDDMLGIQVYYQGIPILNHLGYCVTQRSITLDPEKSPYAQAILNLPYPRKLFPRGQLPPEWKGGYQYGLESSPLTKNTVVVDQYRHGWHVKPDTTEDCYGNLELFKGAVDPDSRAADFQVAEATGNGMMARHPGRLREFRRSVITVTRPDGRPYVIDIFAVKGGKRHLMLWHSIAEEIGSTMPVARTSHETLADWLEESWSDLGVPGMPRRIDWVAEPDRVRGEKQIDSVHATTAIPSPWRHTWRLDYKQWAPKTKDSIAYRRNKVWIDVMKPVSIRVHGLTRFPANGRHYGLHARSNYPGTIRESVDGTDIRGTVVFRDGIDYVGSAHMASEGLETTFIHVLEPWGDGEQPFIQSARALGTADGGPPPHGSGAIELTFIDGGRDVVAFTHPQTGRLQTAGGVELQGRFALVRLDAAGEAVDARLVSGTSLRYVGNTLLSSPQADYTGGVVALLGDMNGDRGQSAIVVTPDRPWPNPSVLTGHYVHVSYPPRRVEGYVIESIATQPDGDMRITLKGTPPFVDVIGEVYELQLDGHKNWFSGTKIAKGGGMQTAYLDGSRIAFPTLGIELTHRIDKFRGFLKSGYRVAEDVDLAELGVSSGTPFVIFPRTEGARVRIVGEAI